MQLYRYWQNLPVSVLAVALAALLLVLFEAGLARADDDDDDDGGEEFVNGEIVVKLDTQVLNQRGETCDAVIGQINNENGTGTIDKFLNNGNIACIYLLKVQDLSRDTETVADNIEDDLDPRGNPRGRVLYAEPNFTTDAPEGGARMRSRADSNPQTSTNPTQYTRQYAVEKMGLSGAHGTSRGNGAVVAVLDTGVQPDHPELAGSLVAGYDFIGDDSNPTDESNGLDDDADGEVDEMVGHGTHVAGIVHLAAPEARIMPLRVLDSDGRGNVFVIAEAVQYAINGPDRNPATGDGADVINLGLGSSSESELLGDVLESLAGEEDDDGGEADDDDEALSGVPPEGIFVAASAGNEASEVEQYPAASEEGVTAVTAVGADGSKADFSSFGSWTDVAAPGDDIHSLFPTSRYARWDGTSMAAPFVAGQAALIRSLAPDLPASLGDEDEGEAQRQSIAGVIESTARPLDAQNPAYAGKLGSGHADACASLKALRPATACGAGATPADTAAPDTSISSGPSGPTRATSATLGFASEPGARFECSLNGAAFAPCASPKTYSGLDSRAHTFRVRAVDRAGNADASPDARAWTVDAVPPGIARPSPDQGARTRDRTPTVRAVVRDSQTNLGKGNVRLFVAGRRAARFSYDPTNDRLAHTTRKLPHGRHTVKVVATDAAGNTAQRSWSFTVRR